MREGGCPTREPSLPVIALIESTGTAQACINSLAEATLYSPVASVGGDRRVTRLAQVSRAPDCLCVAGIERHPLRGVSHLPCLGEIRADGAIRAMIHASSVTEGFERIAELQALRVRLSRRDAGSSSVAQNTAAE